MGTRYDIHKINFKYSFISKYKHFLKMSVCIAIHFCYTFSAIHFYTHCYKFLFCIVINAAKSKFFITMLY